MGHLGHLSDASITSPPPPSHATPGVPCQQYASRMGLPCHPGPCSPGLHQHPSTTPTPDLSQSTSTLPSNTEAHHRLCPPHTEVLEAAPPSFGCPEPGTSQV